MNPSFCCVWEELEEEQEGKWEEASVELSIGRSGEEVTLVLVEVLMKVVVV